MSEAPDTIHLQWDGDCDVTMVYGEPYADEVTWSINRIYEDDIEYVRASRYREAVKLLRSVLDKSEVSENSKLGEDIDAFLAEEEEPCRWEYGPHREPNRPEWRSGCGYIYPKMLSEDWLDNCPYCGQLISVPGAQEEDA